MEGLNGSLSGKVEKRMASLDDSDGDVATVYTGRKHQHRCTP